MYYRYKIKKKKRPYLKIIVFLALAAGILYGGYSFKHYLLFWKYTTNSILTRIIAAEKISGSESRRSSLNDILEAAEQYKKENPVNSEAFFMSARLQYQLARTYDTGTFSDMVINNQSFENNEKANTHYTLAVRQFKKALLLHNYGDTAPEYLLQFGNSLYMMRYEYPKEIAEILKKIKKPENITDMENRRFYGFIMVLAGEKEKGLQFLEKHCGASASDSGNMFLAMAEKTAENYTAAIQRFKDITGKTTDSTLLKLAHVNLGEIYLKQSLFKESLDQFTAALKYDNNNIHLKISIGRIYKAMGEKDKAKAIFQEILAADKKNLEAKKMLSSM